MYHVREFYPPGPPLPVVKMDPDCAICHAPATVACDCEAKGLETAIRQAEARMMQSIYNDIRYDSPRMSRRNKIQVGQFGGMEWTDTKTPE